ncbi:MAG: glycosyltransferase [Pseudomonadota bacterium]
MEDAADQKAARTAEEGGSASAQGAAPSAGDVAAITVVVPTFNRPEKLKRCLEALDRQSCSDFVVIVVDDGGRADLGPIVEPFAPRISLVRQSNAGPAAARNNGARHARSAFLAFTDDDCEPHPDWLQNLLEELRLTPSQMLGGATENIVPNNVFSDASQSLVDYLYSYFGASDGDMPFFASNNIACSRERYLEIGGFDESFPLAAGEDRDLGHRWRETGEGLRYCPDAVVHHAHVLGLKSFFRQHWNYGRGARHLHLALAKRGEFGPRIQGLGFYFGILLYPLRARRPRALLQSMVLGLSQVAMIAGYLRESVSGRVPKEAPQA